MRHLVKGKKLGRNTSHRKATMKALACSLIEHKSIQTTVAKAKELRRYIEPVITRAKEDTSHNRRQVFSSLQNKTAVSTVFDEIIPEVGDRPGGYTRVLKLGFRLGDSAEMALIELVDFSEYQPEKKSAKKKRTRRAGKSNKPTTDEAEVESKDNKNEETSSAVESKTEETVVKDKKEVASEKEEAKKVEASEAEEKEEVKDQAAESDDKDSEEKEEKDKK